MAQSDSYAEVDLRFDPSLQSEDIRLCEINNYNGSHLATLQLNPIKDDGDMRNTLINISLFLDDASALFGCEQ